MYVENTMIRSWLAEEVSGYLSSLAGILIAQTGSKAETVFVCALFAQC